MERYALFDWDGTLREGYTLFEWIGFLRERGEILSARVLKRHDRLVADYREGRISHDLSLIHISSASKPPSST